MEHGKTPIFNKIVWIIAITGLVLVGCGQKETPKPATAVPVSEAENTANIVFPTETPIASVPTETAVQELPSSPTVAPPTPEPSATNVPEIVPTETAAPSPAGMSLMDWTLWGWTSSTSPMACQDAESACWMLVNYRDSTSLVYAKKITIEPGWTNPTLVYQNRYSIQESKAFGYVEIEVQGEVGWNRVYTIKGSRDYWHEVEIDLSEFSGKTITLRFATRPYVEIIQKGEATKMVYNKQTWIIQNINIVSK